jgi:hypothetical protein
MKPCPHCLFAHWQTGGQTTINNIPQFMDSCRACCDPGEVDLREKEKEQFRILINKARNEHCRKRTSCENIIVVNNHGS